MRKYSLLALTISAILVVSISGCADRSAVEDKSSHAEEITAQIVAEGETVVIDDICEFRIDSINIAKQPELFYEAEAGKVYADLCIACKNLADATVSLVNIITDESLVYSGIYQYTGTLMVEEDDRSWLTSTSYGTIVHSSETAYAHCLFPVPEEIQDSDRMLVFHVTIGGNDYQVIGREGVKGSVSDSGDNGTQGKISGRVADGEVKVTANSEFYVDFVQITDDVVPPNPGTAYNHFAADAGEVYVDFCVAYKNISDQEIRADKAVSAKLTIGEDSYNGASLVEINGRHLFENAGSMYVIPLSTEYIHCLFPIPAEAATGSDNMEISFKIDGKSYTYTVR